MIARLLDRFFRRRTIHNCFGEEYLHRWYILRNRFFAVMVHRFVRSDEDRALHDHPWPFLVIPLWRGYIEHRLGACDCFRCTCAFPSGPAPHGKVETKRRVLPILGARYRPATYQHRVELYPCDHEGVPLGAARCPRCDNAQQLPAWSLFIRFRRCRDWGYRIKQNDGSVVWQQHQAWWTEHCE